jgi:hypothetical protein
MCTARMPRSRSVALEGRLVGCLYRTPPRPRGRRPRGLILTALGGCERAERGCGRERRRGVQKPLAACQGKTVPGPVRLVALGRSVHGGPPRPPAAGSPGSVRQRRAAPNPGQRQGRCRIRAWFESECRHLVHLVADAQREVVDDGVGTVVQRLERQHVAVPPHEHHRCAGEVVGQPGRRLVGGGGVVSSGSVFGSTQCLRKLLKKNFGRCFW